MGIILAFNFFQMEIQNGFCITWEFATILFQLYFFLLPGRLGFIFSDRLGCSLKAWLAFLNQVLTFIQFSEDNKKDYSNNTIRFTE